MKQKILLLSLVFFFAIKGYCQGDSWKKIASLPGCTARFHGIAFGINGKGYYGTGIDSASQTGNSDMWSYDSTLDYWTQVASLPAKSGSTIVNDGRSDATAFTVNNLAFVIGGSSNSLGLLKDVWRYNDTTNTWIAKNDFPGQARMSAVGVGADAFNRAYFGTGFNSSPLDDFWEYNPETDTWVSKPNIPKGRGQAAAFAIVPAGAAGTCIYVVGGGGAHGNGPFYNDLYKFDPAISTWTQGPNLPGDGREDLVAFSLNNKGYAGLGLGASLTFPNDLYMFDGNTNGTTGAWSAVQSLSAGGRFGSSAFTIGKSAFVMGGFRNDLLNVSETWQYNADLNTWAEKKNADIGVRNGASAFSASGFGFVVGGFDGGISGNYTAQNYDAFKYDASANSWSKTTDFASVYMQPAFTINNIGYVYAPSINGDGRYSLWAFDPTTGVWTQKATQVFNIDAFFCINNIAYGQNITNDALVRYNPANNTWANLPGFPGLLQVGSNYRAHGVAFSVNGKGYYGLGNAGSTFFKDMWQFDPANGNWTEMNDFGGGTRTSAVSFVINNYAYVGTGNPDNGTYGSTDFWRYDDTKDAWTRVADIIGGARQLSVAFVINNKAYVGTGDDNYAQPRDPMGTHKDFFEYTPDASTLPVNLLNFTAARRGTDVLLTWQTAQEINSAYFTIQRSTDGQVFNDAGSVEAAGTSAITTNYRFTDAVGKWPAGKLYYRLQETDKDSKKTLSNVAAVTLTNAGSSIIFPNPVRDIMYIQGENIKTVIIIDNTGREILKQPNNGNAILGINVSNLAAGTYTIHTIDTQGKVQSANMLKQ